jgi:hypothetical protein
VIFAALSVIQISERNAMPKNQRLSRSLFLLLLVVGQATTLGLDGCGQTEKPSTPASANEVYAYFGGPFPNHLAPAVSTFDHSKNSIGMSALIPSLTTQVPSSILSGTFAAAPTGFMSVAENFAITTSSGFITAQNPPLTGAWAVEIPGSGALANLLNVKISGSGLPVQAAPAIMAANNACPQFVQTSGQFLYVTVPNVNTTVDTADYGGVDISTQGSAVTFHAAPFLIGPVAQASSTVTGGCSQTIFGPLTAYPLNSFGITSNIELISMSNSGFLVSSFVSGNAGASLGAFGGGTGVVGMSTPANPVDVSTIVSGQYNGFFYAPQTTAATTYDLTALASAFGNHSATSQACSTLQSSLASNSGQGAGTIPVLPSANSLYGGDFPVTTSTVNDPTGALGSENCDVVIDLGVQDAGTNGLFPGATIFIGSNFPPFSTTHPWICTGTTFTCAVSFPAAAIVGTIQGKYVIFIVASAQSTPAAQLPNNSGTPIAQPLGIYLFQK